MSRIAGYTGDPPPGLTVRERSFVVEYGQSSDADAFVGDQGYGAGGEVVGEVVEGSRMTATCCSAVRWWRLRNKMTEGEFCRPSAK